MPRNDLVDFVHIRSLPDWTRTVKPLRLARGKTAAMDSFGKRLRIARKAMGMTLQQLAEKSGCSKQLLSSIELGDTEEVKAALLFNISDALQAAPRWLVFGVGTQRLAGALTDQERDLIYILRVLPPPLQDHLLQVAEGLAVSTKIASPVAPFTVPAPKKPANLSRLLPAFVR